MPDHEKNKVEYRTFDVDSLKVEKRFEEHSQDQTGPEQIIGHAAVFDVIGDGGWFREKIAPGAFINSIQKDDIRALFNHDPNFVLGRNKAGSLSLREDEKGLLVLIDPPGTQFAEDLKKSIARGDISQMSFGFEIIREERTKGQNGDPDLFILREVKLWDVSPVTFPFYKETDVTVHSRSEWAESQRSTSTLKPMRKIKVRLQEFKQKYSK